MNIKEAKEIVKATVTIYTEKDARGDYILPRSQKRPVMLIGAPGIGKTDIMKQVAAEAGIPLLSYTMTHLTRQSLIGLPALKTAVFGGKEYSITENTLSDMMVAILRMQEVTGKKEGILFLDEVNCVSETLSATMLDLLQNKRIGNHEIPDGWILITAGNPPQYNKSVKEYDVATMDRLRMVHVEPSLSIWKEYAYNAGTHPAIMSFLELNEGAFYKISTTVDGKKYATARGWSDLSSALYAYERAGLKVSDDMVLQYITEVDIARKFSVYYTLYKKYRMDYSVQDILDGKNTDTAASKAANASFDERLSVISMLMEGIGKTAKETMTMDTALQEVVRRLRMVKKSASGTASVWEMLQDHIEEINKNMESMRVANSLSPQQKENFLSAIDFLKKYQEDVEKAGKSGDAESEFKVAKASFNKDVKAMERKQKKLTGYLENAFEFVSKAWGEEHEMTLFATEVTVNRNVADFIARYGSDAYFKHNKSLLTLDQEKKITEEISKVKTLVAV